MSAESFFFYLFSGMTLLFGLLAVSARGLFRSAIYLLVALVNVAALYFLLNYEFIAAVQVVVYVGGIVVLILFSLFLTQQTRSNLPLPDSRSVLLAVAGCAGSAGVVLLILSQQKFQVAVSQTVPGVRDIGMQMLSLGKNGYVLPFEAISVLLLAAMIGCIVVAFKPGTNG